MSSALNRLSNLAAHLLPERTEKSLSVSEQVDVLIVGAGVIGAATAYAITKARPDLNVLLLEAGTLGAIGGRELYSSEYSSVMQTEALKLWAELEEESGQKLLRKHGVLNYGEPDRGEAVQGSLLACKQVAERRGLPHKVLSTAAKLQAEFPMNAKEGYQGLFEPGAGSIKAKEAVLAMLTLAQQAGLQVVEGEQLTGLAVPAASQVVVTTSKQRTITAKRMALTVGAWTNEVLSHLGMQLSLEIWKVHWGHYYVDPAVLHRLPQWYKFCKLRPDSWDEGLYYGFPAEDAQPLVKVGVDFAPPVRNCCLTSMRDFTYTPDQPVADALDRFLKTEWKGFLQCKDLYCSPYTMTSDGMFVLDQLPGYPEVSVFTGGNGRAFKFAILLGRCLLDLVTDQEPLYNIAPLKADRAAVRVVQTATSAALS